MSFTIDSTGLIFDNLYAYDTRVETTEKSQRETRLVKLGVKNVAAFRELVLTNPEEQKLNEVKLALIGTKVKLSNDAFNRTDDEGLITDVRIVVAHGRILPCAIVKFPSLGCSVLRQLRDLVPSTKRELEKADSVVLYGKTNYPSLDNS